MVFVYIRIYYAARARSRRAQENKAKRRQSQTIKQEAQQKQAAEAAASAIGTMVAATAAAMQSPAANAPAPGGERAPPPASSPPPAGAPAGVMVVANGHPAATALHDSDRRFSLNSEMSGLKPAPGLPSVPSLSMDRISGSAAQQEQHQQYLMAESEMHSTAPGSLMTINETSAGGVGDSSQHRQERRQSSLKKNGNNNGARQHSVTFERNSVDAEAVATVQAAQEEGAEAVPLQRLGEVADVAPPPCPVLPPVQPAPSSTRRASLIFPTRKKFEKLARRLAGSDGMCASASVLHPIQQQPEGESFGKNDKAAAADLQGNEEWSTSSYPSSPGHPPDKTETGAGAADSLPPTVPATSAPTSTPHPPATVPSGATSGTTATSTKVSNNKNRTNKKKTKDETNVDNEMPSEIEPSSSDSGTVARCTVVRPLKIRFCRPGGHSSGTSNSVKKSSKAKRQVRLLPSRVTCWPFISSGRGLYNHPNVGNH